LSSWKDTCKEYIDYEDFSSSSWIFYCLLSLNGIAELLLAISLYFGYEPIHFEPVLKHQSIGYNLYGGALLIEGFYIFVTRFILFYSYTASFGTSAAYLVIATFVTTLTILPLEMVLFFGYIGSNTHFEKTLLNLAWLRRIFSLSRIVVMFISVSGLVHGGMITLVFCISSIQFTLLMVALCP